MTTLKTVLPQQPSNLRFFVILIGLFLSRMGTNIYTLALPWIAYDLTESAVVLGSVFMVEMLPFVLLLPFGGVLIDRMDRRKIMMVSDVLRMLLVISVPLLYWLDSLVLPYLYVLAFMISTFSFFVDVSLMAILPNIAGTERLTLYNSRIQLVENLSRFAGPLVAGAILGVIGAHVSLMINGLAYLAMAFCIFLIGNIPQQLVEKNVQHLWDDVKEGFVYLWDNANLRAIAWISVLCNFGMSLVMSTLIFYLREVLQTDEFYTGIVYGAIGVFGILGSLITEPLTKRFPRGVLVALLLLFCGGIGALLIAFVKTWYGIALGLGIWGGSITMINVILNTYKQETVENVIYGRVEGSLTSFSYLSLPLAGLVGGMLMETFGSTWSYSVAAMAVVFAGLIVFITPLRRI